MYLWAKMKLTMMLAAAVLLAIVATSVAVAGDPPKSPATQPATLPATKDVLQPVRDQLAAIRARIDAAGHGRINNQPAVVDAGFAYLAEQIRDETVAKFNPRAGFTHYGVSRDDKGDTYLLVERVDGERGGLNLRYDPATRTITSAKYWGVRAPQQ